MLTGLIDFIRDPDDPTFHPVRDVLERNVATQLRKITFSAMVYGALVVLCLGGVVWTLAYTLTSVLPIHWSSNEPVLEFPIDLLFYNFFMPLAVKFFKPSDGLHMMYTWWFRRCARSLRLTWFLFDERKVDEEGHHERKTWLDILKGAQGDPENPVKNTVIVNGRSLTKEERVRYEVGVLERLEKDKAVSEPNDSVTSSLHDETPVVPEPRAQFVRDGRYVRTPASDQVRLPKDRKAFLEVNEVNQRVDGQPDRDDGLHGAKSDMFKMVYLPPNFRIRVFFFIVSIWLFAAVTGVSFTVIPLVLGRKIFARVIPAHVQKNDVYAFSIGIYILGSLIYCLLHLRGWVSYLRNSLKFDTETPAKVFRKIAAVGLWLGRLTYAYAAFGLVLPTLFAMAIEFYLIIPLHTYFAPNETHVVHFVQSWTLGLLYVKLSSRFILWHAESRPAEALRAVTRNGYMDPDVRVATRCFIFPATVVLSTALIIPFILAAMANRWEVFGAGEIQQALVFRYAYPLCLSVMVNACATWVMIGMLKGWRMRIRDEVYLIGERLHNFGDRSKSGAGNLIPSSSRIEA